MKQNIFRINEQKRIVGGVVKDVDLRDNVANVTLVSDVYNSESKTNEENSLKISFWNNDYSKMRDIVEKCNLEGKTILVEVYEGSDGKLVGNRLHFRGSIIEIENEDKHNFVIFANMVSPTVGFSSKGNKYLRVSVPITNRDKETEWHNITLWDDENHENATNLNMILEKAQKCISGVFVCSGNPSEYNGKYTYTAYSFNLA